MALKPFRDAVRTTLIIRKMSGRVGATALAACFLSPQASLHVVSIISINGLGWCRAGCSRLLRTSDHYH